MLDLFMTLESVTLSVLARTYQLKPGTVVELMCEAMIADANQKLGREE
jgi:hypothetical protein